MQQLAQNVTHAVQQTLAGASRLDAATAPPHPPTVSNQSHTPGLDASPPLQLQTLLPAAPSQ
jgi:hypothetical protein